MIHISAAKVYALVCCDDRFFKNASVMHNENAPSAEVHGFEELNHRWENESC